MTGDLRVNVYDMDSEGGREALLPVLHYSSFSTTAFPLSLILGLFQFTQSLCEEAW